MRKDRYRCIPGGVLMSRISHLLTQRVTTQEVDGLDGNGDPSYGPLCEIACRIEHHDAINVTAKGTNLGSEHKSETTILTDKQLMRATRIWLPGTTVGDDNQCVRPISTECCGTPDGSLAIWETSLG
jgi:hypothetical protein